MNGSGGTFREIRNDFLVGSLLEGEMPIKRHGHLADTAYGEANPRLKTLDN